MAKNKLGKDQKHRRPVVPKEYQGKWIAWNSEGSKILSSGETLEQARNAAIAGGEEDPELEWVPNGLIIGFRV